MGCLAAHGPRVNHTHTLGTCTCGFGPTLEAWPSSPRLPGQRNVFLFLVAQSLSPLQGPPSPRGQGPGLREIYHPLLFALGQEEGRGGDSASRPQSSKQGGDASTSGPRTPGENLAAVGASALGQLPRFQPLNPGSHNYRLRPMWSPLSWPPYNTPGWEALTSPQQPR